jgi:hypothetical protein
MEERKFECGQCAYYESTGCPDNEGFCIELEIRVCEFECICNRYREIED